MQLSVKRKTALGGGILLALASCATPPGGTIKGPGTRPSASGSGPVVSDVPVKIGKPYTVGGITYTPADEVDYDDVGYASWYGEELNGNTTANGEAFNPAAITAAHRTLPLPSYVEVTALSTGRTIVVRVNDRGPFSNDRLIDLSRGAAEQLGISGHGATPVRVRRVNPPEQERSRLRAGTKVPERIQAPEGLLLALRKKLAEKPAPKNGAQPTLPYSVPTTDAVGPVTRADEGLPPSRNGYLVQLISFSSRQRAEKAAKRTGARLSVLDGIWRVRTGPYTDEASARRGVAQAAASGFNGAMIVVNGETASARIRPNI